MQYSENSFAIDEEPTNSYHFYYLKQHSVQLLKTADVKYTLFFFFYKNIDFLNIILEIRLRFL